MVKKRLKRCVVHSSRLSGAGGGPAVSRGIGHRPTLGGAGG
jgi:hypothetical protein